MKQFIHFIFLNCLLFVSAGCSRVLDSNTGKWEVHEDISPLDDSKTVIMALSSEDRIGQTRPQLVVRCMESKTHVFIDYDTILGRPGYDVTVWTRFDQRPAESSRWALSSSGTAIFADYGVSLALEIASARKLFVRVIPERGNRISATFQLKGSVEAMRPLREACGW